MHSCCWVRWPARESLSCWTHTAAGAKKLGQKLWCAHRRAWRARRRSVAIPYDVLRRSCENSKRLSRLSCIEISEGANREPALCSHTCDLRQAPGRKLVALPVTSMDL